jgi:hypothetical protein
MITLDLHPSASQVHIYLAQYTIQQRFLADTVMNLQRIVSSQWGDNCLYRAVLPVVVLYWCIGGFACIYMSVASVVTWFWFPFQVSEVAPLLTRLP